MPPPMMQMSSLPTVCAIQSAAAAGKRFKRPSQPHASVAIAEKGRRADVNRLRCYPFHTFGLRMQTDIQFRVNANVKRR
jgi:hypothetical protein